MKDKINSSADESEGTGKNVKLRTLCTQETYFDGGTEIARKSAQEGGGGRGGGRGGRTN